jgi:hypothetical protein
MANQEETKTSKNSISNTTIAYIAIVIMIICLCCSSSIGGYLFYKNNSGNSE